MTLAACARSRTCGPTGRPEPSRRDLLARVRGLEPERRPVEPGPRHASLRRADRGVRPGPAGSARPVEASAGRRRGRGPRRRRADWVVRRRPDRADDAGRPTTSISGATRRSPTCVGRSAPASIDRARQALHDDRHRRRPGQDLGVVASARSPRPSSARRSAPSASRPSGRHHAGQLRAARRPRPRRLADPVRTTPIQPWHVANGAVFEDVGQWKRPRYFPREGEIDGRGGPARVRGGADGGRRHGRHDPRQDRPQGPDAGVFLDRVYTKRSRRCKVGSCRYGVMCRPTGWSSTTA